MKESRKEFIKKAHSAACSDWKTNIEKEFPKLFKEDALVVGKWCKINNEDGYLLNYSGTGTVFGFLNGNYRNDYNFDQYHYDNAKPATDKEVEEALIKEAKKRGFKEGVKYENYLGSNGFIKDSCWKFISSLNTLSQENNEGNNLHYIFDKGKWAEIIKETITKEQAEKELGKTILD